MSQTPPEPCTASTSRELPYPPPPPPPPPLEPLEPLRVLFPPTTPSHTSGHGLAYLDDGGDDLRLAAVGAGGEGEAEGDGVDRLVEQRLGRRLLDDVAQRLQTQSEEM